MNSLICYENEKRHHGVFMEVKGNNAESVMIKLPKYGFFPRLVRTMSLLNYGSIFSDFIIDFEMKEGKINDIALRQNSKKLSVGNEEFFPLQDLFDADIVGNYERLDLEYQAYKMRLNFLNVSKLLKNHILLFVACSLARYNPGAWKEIYDGETTDYFIRMQRSIENVSDIINQISRDFNGFQKKKTQYDKIHKRRH